MAFIWQAKRADECILELIYFFKLKIEQEGYEELIFLKITT